MAQVNIEGVSWSLGPEIRTIRVIRDDATGTQSNKTAEHNKYLARYAQNLKYR